MANGLERHFPIGTASAPKALGVLQNPIATSPCLEPTFCARHLSLLLYTVRKHQLDLMLLALVDQAGVAQPAFPLGALLGQDMTLARLVMFDPSLGGQAKSFLRT